MKYQSLRQADLWAVYLRLLKWDIKIIKSGAKIAIMKTPLGAVCKIQRPFHLSTKDLDEIEKICSQRKCMFIKIEAGMDQDENLLTDKGYVRSRFPLSPPSTMIMDLTKSEEEMWSSMSKSGKYSINRAKREGNVVKHRQNPDDKELEEFYAVAKETSKRGKFYIEPFRALLKKRDVFKDKAFLSEVYDDKNRLVSAKFFLGADGMVTFLQGGTSEVGRKGKGGYLLLWDCLLYFKELGYTQMDLEGIDDPRFPLFTKNWGGFSHFKEKFGGTILRLPPPYIKFKSPLLKFISKFQEIPL